MKHLSKSLKALLFVYAVTILPLLNIIRIVLGVNSPSTFDVAFVAVSAGLLLCITISGPSILNENYVDDAYIERYLSVRYLTMCLVIIISLLSIQVRTFTNDKGFLDRLISIISFCVFGMVEVYIVTLMINNIKETNEDVRKLKGVKK